MSYHGFIAAVATGTALFANSIAPTAAAAASDVEIRYSAEDLRTPQAVTALHERLSHDVGKACRKIDGFWHAYTRNSCHAELMDDLLKQINSPRLWAFHKGDTSIELVLAD